jgi:tetratricopeptide (TPR) repeat protein
LKIGPYDVLSELGRGGMSMVFRVRTPRGDEAALKVLTRVDQDAFARFERERRLLASVGTDQGFVGLLDAGRSPEGVWLVMPLVPGGTLRARLAAGPLGVEETVGIGVALATSLGAAHERGIVHRDVKPENVIFTASGRPLIADLGLAKHFDRRMLDGSQSASLSTAGSFRGTAGYMAPEQLEDAKAVGPAADVFALGAILYECLAGQPAFAGDNLLELLARVSDGAVAPLRRKDAPPALEAAIRKALERDPRARFPDGAGFARALRDLNAPRRAARIPIVAFVAGLVVLVGLVFLVRTWRHTVSIDELRAKVDADVDAERWKDAQVHLTELIALDGTLAWAWAKRSGMHHQLDEIDAALADAEKAIALDTGLGFAWANRGIARYGKGDMEGAIADTTRAVEIDPDNARAFSCRGAARGMRGDLDGEIADLTRAIELDPTLVPALINRCLARGKKGDADGAIADATRAVELAPNLPAAWLNRGWARGMKNDREGQRDDSSKAIELAPSSPDGWVNRGQAKQCLGDLDGCIADETRAIELDPRNVNAYENRGIAKGNGGDWQGEIDDETRTIEIDPLHRRGHFNRAVARAKLNDTNGAVADFQRFLELAPDDENAAKAREYLEAVGAAIPR